MSVPEGGLMSLLVSLRIQSAQVSSIRGFSLETVKYGLGYWLHNWVLGL